MADGVLIAPGTDKISVKNVTDGIWASVFGGTGCLVDMGLKALKSWGEV